jgi:hypothetical protein
MASFTFYFLVYLDIFFFIKLNVLLHNFIGNNITETKSWINLYFSEVKSLNM